MYEGEALKEMTCWSKICNSHVLNSHMEYKIIYIYYLKDL